MVAGDPVMDAVLDSKSHVVKIAVDGASPSVCARLAADRLLRGERGSPHTLMPLYIRRSDAEVNRERAAATTRG